MNSAYFRLLFLIGYLVLSISPAIADGFIIVPPPHPVPVPIFPTPVPYHFAPLAVKYHRVDVDITDQKAVTTIDQAFFNPNNRRLEGTYIFPVPKGAHFDRFSMDIDGKMVEAELLSADKARRIYEDIVRRAKDPALLEYMGQEAFKVRIYPIEPHSTKRIKISYTQILQQDFGMMEYLYPLNTEKFSSRPLDEVSLKVDIHGSGSLKNVHSPSHEVEVTRHGTSRVVVGFEQSNVRPDRDFKLIFSRSSSRVGMDIVTHRPDPNQPGYFMLMISPGELKEAQADGHILAKDLTMIMDSSGSMAGKKMAQARKALTFCLDNLNEQDRFELIRFSTEAEPFFNKLAPVNNETLAEASTFIGKIKPIGGTAIHEALDKGLRLQESGKTRPQMVLFITDGLPTIGETDEDKIVNLIADSRSRARIFTFGLGHDVNTHLLDRIAEKTGGKSRYVLPEEDLEIKLSNFYRKISDPVMVNPFLSTSMGKIRLTRMQPSAVPDIFNGDQVLLFGRYEGQGRAELVLTGTMTGKEQVFRETIQLPTQTAANAFVGEMWAARRVGMLLDQIRLNGESAELKDEITRLARKFGIVTPYTAWLIMEDEQVRRVPEEQRNFRELAGDLAAAEEVQQSYQSMAGEAKDLNLRSGKAAVRNAQEVQGLKDEESMAYRTRPSTSLRKQKVVDASKGDRNRERNYGSQVRMVQGRAFYQNGSVWNDSTAQGQSALKTKEISFSSKEYFALLNRFTEAAAWLALGRQVDVVLGGVLYQIR